MRVLLIGASGVFGSRLAEGLSRERGIHLTLAGRNRGTLDAVAASLGRPCAVVTINRDTICADDLTGFDMVIDAAGPFQLSHTQVIQAALSARCHYVDLSDGREFLSSIGTFDAAAREAGIAVISGASSIPALSHAAIDNITGGWQRIDSISMGIFPGNRAPRGRAVVEAILSYVGKPVRVFRGGTWQNVPGWSMAHRVDVPGMGKRWASVCDTPEQDLLVARYAPTCSAEFFAGLELSLLHLGLAILAWPVRMGLIKSLRSAAGVMLNMAQLLLPFGSDTGAMDIQIEGVDAHAHAVRSRWTLQASGNRGPYVPTLAALVLARQLRDTGALPTGASPCSGILRLSDFASDFKRLGITVLHQNSIIH